MIVVIEFSTGDINMKKIYTFTLESDDYPSDKFDNNLRLMAYMLYNEIYNYDGENNNPLNINKNIVYNELREKSISDVSYGYRFDSEISGIKSIFYEPFIIGSKSFGFTVNDNMLDENILKELIDYVLGILKLNYTVNVNLFYYDSKDNEDEKNRKRAIQNIFEQFGSRLNFHDSIFKLSRGIDNGFKIGRRG